MFPQNSQSFQRRLLCWYWSNARDLPWRQVKDPYKIWISEIMLQQTRVDTVIPYYQRWVKRFPTMICLANAPLAEVMKYWAGLGYYRRARSLHQTAKIIRDLHQGQLPATVEELLKLPGIGRYTAGAISSIAFDRKSAILDGNVIRIITRITAFPGDIQIPRNIKKLWVLSASVLPEKNPGDFNQAMMELGATVCDIEKPRCGICPVSKYCRAYQEGRANLFPIQKKKETIRKKNTVALVLRNNGRVLLQKQPENSAWGGLWVFPFWKNRKTMLESLPVRLQRIKRRMTLYHSYTKYRIRLEVYDGEIFSEGKKRNGFKTLCSPNASNQSMRWVEIQKLAKLAFPSPHQQIAKNLTTSIK